MKVAIAGKFDPVHDGHISHIIEASRLGDYLYIITHDDDIVAKTSKKGFCAVPLQSRKILLKGILLALGIEGEVLESIDEDGTVTDTLRSLKPDIFARGGDRVEGTLPDSEIEVCKEIGCRIAYGIGKLLNSSSNIEERLNE